MNCELCQKDNKPLMYRFRDFPKPACVCTECMGIAVEAELARKKDWVDFHADNAVRQKRKCEGCKYERGPECLHPNGVCWEYQKWTQKGGA